MPRRDGLKFKMGSIWGEPHFGTSRPGEGTTWFQLKNGKLGWFTGRIDSSRTAKRWKIWRK